MFKVARQMGCINETGIHEASSSTTYPSNKARVKQLKQFIQSTRLALLAFYSPTVSETRHL
jgi:hypothetical protein